LKQKQGKEGILEERRFIFSSFTSEQEASNQPTYFTSRLTRTNHFRFPKKKKKTNREGKTITSARSRE
jgi:hypothetical protein